MAEDIAARLLESLQTPFLISGNVTRIQASIGIAHSNEHLAAGDLMREADMAMYRAKGLGKNRIMVFEPSLRSETLYRLELEDELRQALASGHIQLNFQPLVDLVSGKVLGFEALARWEHEKLGSVSPAVFVPMAEQLGLMSQLGSARAGAAARRGGQPPGGERVAPVAVGQRLAAGDRRAAAAGTGAPVRRGLPGHRPGHRAHRVRAARRRPGHHVRARGDRPVRRAARRRRLRRRLLLDRLPQPLPRAPGQDRQVVRADRGGRCGPASWSRASWPCATPWGSPWSPRASRASTART